MTRRPDAEELLGEFVRLGVHEIYVRHDDDCALLATNGPCNCNPNVSMSGAS